MTKIATPSEVRHKMANEAIANIQVILGTDLQNCTSELAKRGSVLACAECGRAMWMHGTRHDTCASFCWVTAHTITRDHLIELRFVPGITLELSADCSKALNDFGGYTEGEVWLAKRRCAAAINNAKRDVTKVPT